LNSPEDFEKLSGRGFSNSSLSALLIQKGIKKAKKYSFRIRNNYIRIRKDWLGGKSFSELASEYGVFPIAVAYHLRQDIGFTRKDFQRILASAASSERAPEKARKESKEARVYREMWEATRTDWLHSPRALSYMKRKGELGEEFSAKFLAKIGITKFKTEKEQEKGGKTPDFLFEGLEKIPGAENECKWFESKATFGTFSEAKEDFRSQLTFYTGLFGSGAIVYWLGLTREAREFLEKSSEGKIRAFSGEELAGIIGENNEALFSAGMKL